MTTVRCLARQDPRIFTGPVLYSSRQGLTIGLHDEMLISERGALLLVLWLLGIDLCHHTARVLPTFRLPVAWPWGAKFDSRNNLYTVRAGSSYHCKPRALLEAKRRWISVGKKFPLVSRTNLLKMSYHDDVDLSSSSNNSPTINFSIREEHTREKFQSPNRPLL